MNARSVYFATAPKRVPLVRRQYGGVNLDMPRTSIETAMALDVNSRNELMKHSFGRAQQLLDPARDSSEGVSSLHISCL